MDNHINPPGSTRSKAGKPRKTKKTTGTSDHTGTSDPTGTATQPNPPTNEETQVILDQVTSEVATENITPRLKTAGLDPLPDDTLLAGGAASMLLMLLDGIGMLAFGDYAKLTPIEKQMIEEPLERILKRVSPGALTAVNKYTDPILLLMGMLAWVSRINSEAKRREAEKNSAEPANKFEAAPSPGAKKIDNPIREPDAPINTNIPLDLLDTLRMAEL